MSRCRNKTAAPPGEGNRFLRDMYVGQTHIIDVLAQQFDAQVSREIPHEVRRHKNLLGNYAIQMLKLVRRARRYFYCEQVYESLIFTQG